MLTSTMRPLAGFANVVETIFSKMSSPMLDFAIFRRLAPISFRCWQKARDNRLYRLLVAHETVKRERDDAAVEIFNNLHQALPQLPTSPPADAFLAVFTTNYLHFQHYRDKPTTGRK